MASPVRARWLLLVAFVVAIIGGYFVWDYLSQWESTDDAQVDGHIHPINARVGGTVTSVTVKENEHVKADMVLVQLDPRDYQVAVSRAEAELADAEAAVVAARANVPIASSSAGTQISTSAAATARAHANVEASNREVMAAQARVSAAEARVKEAEATAVKATRDLERMKMLIQKDEISQQQYDAAVSTADAAHAAVESAKAAASQVEHEVEVAKAHTAQARAELQQAQAEAEGAKTAPQQVTITRAQAQSAEARVQLAKAALDQARLNLEYTTIKAPVSGTVSRKTVEVGQVVQAGQPMMAIVPHEDIWVTANFKETQLAGMHPGQAATVSVDAYSRSYNAHIDSIASATGARFSLLPPENATGNYVKVVQRVPVKIVLDEGQDGDHQLRPGMSVVAKVKMK
jgi:membrane fusion protein (multidrug efflux system)